ncbi:hypothetical protein HYH03_016054 [Edaphochlamys debaryana]|uniref:EGF-like domain-containing protein n=1 Tax=Edaphochlamys debaryana TaxID=47281 RepID=A0A835XSE3_9CHLO|nr:hypothetical protein HYH03_016054 [Edaphochlamys debaryana]|eukprot:KAG2485164.1 hypothetical protein HYH03_016054 [Edaphochlamys debaryana]
MKRMSILAAVLATAALVSQCQAESPFREENKACDPGCSKHGNCNGETGQCDCPFGLTGPTCTERLLPACHPSANASAIPAYGFWFPKNCECYRQLRALPGACPEVRYEGTGAPDFAPCLIDALLQRNLLCYQYTDRPEADQLSDSPPLNDSRIEWRHITPYPTLTEVLLPPDKWPTEVKTPDGGVWRPLSECPDSCNLRGWCQVGGRNYLGVHQPSEGPWCNCHSYYQGKSCEIANPYHCYRNCSRVGQCVRGWCHCQPGYWGHGCTRRKAYTSSGGWRPNHGEIKIYVYDLPNNVVHRREFNDNWALIDPMYLAEIEFMEQLLGDWSVRTENPWEASLFVVPTFTYWYSANVGNPYLVLDTVTRHLQQTSPFWNATDGRSHVFFATNDRGACKLQLAPPELQHSIKVVHYGLAPRRPYARHNNPEAGLHLTGNLALPGHRFEGFPEFSAEAIMEEHTVCYRPEKDVVTPNDLHPDWVKPENYVKTWALTVQPDGTRVVSRRPHAPERNITFFFSGYTKDKMLYSHGVRQAVHRLFGAGGKHNANGSHPRPDYRVSMPAPDAIDAMHRSKFCFAPSGAGWGIRLAEAMVTGCVPVIVQDHVYQALWDVLPYEEFSIRISRAELHGLVNILDDVTPEQLKKLQDGVTRWHRAFYWPSMLGGLAYNYTVTALKRRALRLWSEDYRHRRHVRRLRG